MLPGQPDYASNDTVTSLPLQNCVEDDPRGVDHRVEVFTKSDSTFSSVQGPTYGSSSDAEVLQRAKAPAYHGAGSSKNPLTPLDKGEHVSLEGEQDEHVSLKGELKGEHVSLEDFLTPLLAFMALLFGFPVYPTAPQTGGVSGSRYAKSVSTSDIDVDCRDRVDTPRTQQKTCFSVLEHKDGFYENNTPEKAKFDQNAPASAGRSCELTSLCCFIRKLSATGWRWWRRAAFCVVISLQVFSVARSVTAFTDPTVPSSQWVTSVSYQVTWTQQLLLYLLTHHSLSCHFPDLLSLIRQHEARHGLSVKLNRSKAKFRWAVVSTGIFSVYVLLVFIWLIHQLPKCHGFLRPFESVTGAPFTLLALLMSATIAITVNLNLSLLCLLALLSYVIRKDMLHVTHEFRMLLSPSSSQTERIDKLETNRTDDSEAGNTTFLRNFEKRLRNVSAEVSIPAANAGRKKLASLSSYAFQNSLINNEQPSKLREFSAARRDDGPAATIPSVSSSAVDVVRGFDQLRRHYESCHALLTLTGSCLRHVAPLCYAGGIPILCCMIYGLASGSLDSGDGTVLVIMTWDNVSLIAIVTVLGFLVHEAATSPCSAILAADWPALPDSLINKLQLFVLRLTTGTMGYSVYGFFVITRNTVLMLAGTFITYSVIVVQFQMGSPLASCCVANATCATVTSSRLD